jgi:hypothetical protein
MGAILAADIVGFCYLTEPRVQARSIDHPGDSKTRRDKSITRERKGPFESPGAIPMDNQPTTAL